MTATSSTSTNFKFRPATMDDIPAVVELVNAASMATMGTPTTNVERMGLAWSRPEVDLETDSQLVFTLEGTLVGYARLGNPPPYVNSFLGGVVHPDYLRQGLGTYLIQWGEQRAHEMIGQAPEGTQVSIFCDHFTTNPAAGQLFAKHDYQLVRHFLYMKIEMAAPPSPPVWPEGLIVRTMVLGQDEKAVYLAIDEAFEDHWGHTKVPFEEGFQRMMRWIKDDPNFDPTLIFLVMDGGEIAAVASCDPHTVEDPDMGYVGSLSVRRPWRRRGVALALLQHVFGEFYRRGTRKVGLDVDASSLTGATRLYEKAGMVTYRQVDVSEKVIRPGKVMFTQSV